MPIQLDVTDQASWADAADTAEQALGPITILVNNAGVISVGPLAETAFADWQRNFRVNVDGPFLGTSTFLPRMLERSTPAHVLTTASMGALMPIAGVGAYVSSKFAAMGFCRTLREELKDTNVSVSVLTPGTVATGMNPTGAAADQVGKQVVEALARKQFLIPTHGDFEPILAGMHREIEQAFADTDDRHGPDPSVQMLLSGTDPLEQLQPGH